MGHVLEIKYVKNIVFLLETEKSFDNDEMPRFLAFNLLLFNLPNNSCIPFSVWGSSVRRVEHFDQYFVKHLLKGIILSKRLIME